MSSKVQTILDNMVTTLRAINGSAPYTNTMPTSDNSDVQPVEANARVLGEIPEDQFPHFNIIFKEELRTKEPSFLRAVLSTQILCTFNNSTESEIASWLADVEIALAQDIRRGTLTYVIDSWVPAIRRDEGAHPPYRIVTMDVECVYTFPFGSP